MTVKEAEELCIEYRLVYWAGKISEKEMKRLM